MNVTESESLFAFLLNFPWGGVDSPHVLAGCGLSERHGPYGLLTFSAFPARCDTSMLGPFSSFATLDAPMANAKVVLSLNV